MRVGFTFLTILLIGIIPFGILTPTVINEIVPFEINSESELILEDTAIQDATTKIPIPSPDLGSANWSSNHFQNPSFEDWSSQYECDGWTVSKTGDRHHWIETSIVSEGSYSGGLQCQNYPTQAEDATFEQSGMTADFSNLSLSFDWYLDQNEDPSQDVMYAEVQLQDGTFTYWLFYYLNGSSAIDQNSTWEGYFLFDHYPSQQWNTISRNLTADFLSVSELSGSYSENLYVDNIRLRLESFGGTNELIRGFFDDLKLINETNGYYWVGGSTRNGNFETGDFTSWTILESTDSGHFEQSSTAYTGILSANITAYSVGNFSEARFRDYPYTRLTSMNQGHVSMWWYLNYQNLTDNTYGFIAFQCFDGAIERDIYYILGYGGTTCPILNSSSSVVLKPDNFNTTASWNHLDVNIWADASSRFSLNELMVRYVEIAVIAEGTEVLMSTLIDNVTFRAPALNHADFEDQPAVGQSVQGFTTTSSRMIVTGSAYSGSKAGNLTQTSGTLSLRHALQWRPLNSSRETYLDAMWLIQDSVPANQVWFRMTFTNGRELNYFMNGLTTSTSNTSSAGYFNASGAGTIGVWTQLHRDLVHDYVAVYGSLPDTTIENLYLRTSTSGRLEILFDDFYLYDDPAPQLSSVSRSPINPDHQEAVQVLANAIDQDLETVLINFRVDGGSWQKVTMSHQAGDTFSGIILGQDHNSVVEYFITANDTWGLTTTALDGGSYWSYTVTDQTAPSIDNLIQTPSPVGYLDSVNITAEITEEGSGIQKIDLFYRIDGGVWQNNPMVSTGSTGYYAIIGLQPYNTFVEYYVNVTDNVDLQDISSTYSYTVTDTIPPVITNVAHTPTPVEYTDSPTVSCNATDAQSGVSTVVIYYRVDGGGWNTVSMSSTTGTGYAGNIPAQSWNVLVEYFVNATDNAGAWDVDDNLGVYYTYTVSDSVDPQISNLDRDPFTVEYINSPIISCDATDVGSEIASVTLYYRVNDGGWNTISMLFITDSRYEGSIPTQSWNDFIEYYIVGIDNAGNSVTEDNSGAYYSYTVVDNTDPIISNVGHMPLIVTSSDIVTVGCDVSDVGSDVSTVTLWYRLNFGGWSSTTMNPTGMGDRFEANIGAMTYATFTEYYVVATDAATNSATEDNGGSYYNFTVTETTPPDITSISHSPIPVEYFDSPIIGCNITDTESGVGIVTLYYRVNSGGWNQVSMSHIIDERYEGAIPAQAWNDFVEYYVNATDNENNFAVNDNGGGYYSYTVQDNTDPIISNIGQSPISVEYTDSTIVSCDASDPGSDIDYVRLYYRIDGGS
ncbi:MAG: hypothetical protein ACFFD8_01175 [Candidatus Thorarchaeota archaeon]